MNDFALDIPLNNLSFGQVSVAILREIHKRGLNPNVFPIQPVNSRGELDAYINAQLPDKSFGDWLWNCISKATREHCRKNTSIRLWHINNSLSSFSESDSRLITFHELDQLTSTEVNILRNQDKVYVTSSFSQQIFKMLGVESEYLPLGFDSHNFKVLDKRPKVEGVTSWGLGGKLESRKSHLKIINLWAKRYGNNAAHRLNLAVFNPFMGRDQGEIERNINGLIMQALEGKQYWNIGPKDGKGNLFLPHMSTNAEYNQFLQTNDIFFALSGGEGRGLPEYHATALGSWPIALKAHAYLDYLNDDNSIMVIPNGKRPAADGMFFSSGGPFNQGNFFDFGDADFYKACEEAEKRSALGINVNGHELQKLTYSNTVDILLKDLS